MGSGMPRVAAAGLLATALLAGMARAHAQEPGPCLWGGVPLDAVSELVVDYGRAQVVSGERPAAARFLLRGSTLAAGGACPEPPAGFGANRPLTLHHGRLMAGPLPVTLRAVRNSDYPLNRNSGAAWDGAGLNVGARAGFWLRLGPVSAAVSPEVHHQANSAFRRVEIITDSRSRFAYPWHPNIDVPQRHGPDPFTTVSPGQSFVRADLGPVGVGMSTENLWLGSAQRMPLLLSSTAPGFPHAFLELTRPLDIYLGYFGVQMLWGQLHESDYFDFDPDNDRRLFGALVLAFEPKLFPGLQLGAGRVHHRTWRADGMEASDFVEAILDVPLSGLDLIGGVNQPGNSLGAIFGRWVLPESGFEAYFEWAREDYAWDVEDVIKEPDHSRAYALGFQKLVDRGAGNRLRLWGELAHLEASAASLRSGRGVQTIYVHSQVRQGHTNRGQLLGAWVGPGSTAQVLGLDHLTSHGRIGGYVQRVRYNADAYWNNYAHRFGVNGYDVEVAAALRATAALRWGLAASGEVSMARRYNPGFVRIHYAQTYEHEQAFRLDLALSWLPMAPR
jgi:hypothetical protein